MIRVRKIILTGLGLRDPRSHQLDNSFDVARGPTGSMPEPDDDRSERLEIAYDPRSALVHIRAWKRYQGTWSECETHSCSATLVSEMVLYDPPAFPWIEGVKK